MSRKKKKFIIAEDADQNKDSLFAKELESFCAQSVATLQEGEIIKGRVVGVTGKEVLVDIGYKSEGVVSIDEFDDSAEIKINDEINVLLETKEDENGMVIVSKRKADRTLGWERIINNYKEGDIIKGRVTRKVKGGLMVDIGMDAFLPASQVSLRGAQNIDQYVGNSYDFMIVKVNKPRKNIVLSRRELLLKEREESKARLLKEIAVGQIRSGMVKNIADFGVFIDLGGVDGLLHITDMSWGRISHPSEMVAIGDAIEVKILDIDKENMKISLGLKQKTSSPWTGIGERYPVGSKLKGKVVNIVPYGAFIELEKGVEGLIHISEFSWTRRINHPSEVLAIGDIVEAVVLTLDVDNQKIAVGIKQTEIDPWQGISAKYPAGSKVKGRVRNLTDYGAFVELEEGIDGLIHISDISWTKKINTPAEFLKKGQKVEVVVLSIDELNHKISLGLKQLTDDPWPEIVKRYPIDMGTEGQITKITSFGVFVELEKELEGLVHITEINLEATMKIEDAYKVGDKVKAKIIKVDSEQRKIGLSMK
ncbi:MAG: 30S ribosomal protein S1 [Candidatus Omnitrophica bacterium]|nr:30S ribosomal protein S1 [Candidatus Omnitrophota bacterium]MBU4479424.1 30S ribosomal protein S1 [Candidatus Omnitrophota bacterium]MCG2703969.1 30S ribosomal protein S1 [Candidatus Omnitrophota bacterium]